MFDTLTDRLTKVLQGLSGRRLTDRHIQESIQEVRSALLDADVSFDVVRDFTSRVEAEAIGQEILRSLQPREAFIKIVHDQIIDMIGPKSSGLDIQGGDPPVVILVAGLQGSGKTTTVAKIAKYLYEKQSKKVGVVSVDVYRPAAIEQLQSLASQVDARFISSAPTDTAVGIAKSAFSDSRRALDDVLIVDTAGRLAVDDGMMDEISRLHDVLNPRETLFVVDSMMGQDAATTSRAFGDVLPLTGVVVTKVDGDARGGAALSVRAVTGKPIKFLGTGEKVDGLELFQPDRIASRILGMGDVLTLIEEAESKIDKEKVARFAGKLIRGRKFDLQDMQDQMREIHKIGGIEGVLSKLPNLGGLEGKVKVKDSVNWEQMAVIIDSMTTQERKYPNVLNAPRKKRVADGSGTTVQNVNLLLRKYRQMQKQTRKLGRKGGASKKMRLLADLIDTNVPDFSKEN